MKTEYHIIAYWKFNGIDDKFERELSKSIGKKHNGTGTCFVNSERDISWVFKTEKDAKRAASKLKRFKGIKRIDIYLYEEKKHAITNYKKIMGWNK